MGSEKWEVGAGGTWFPVPGLGARIRNVQIGEEAEDLSTSHFALLTPH